MLLCSLLASAIVLAPVPDAPTFSVAGFDQRVYNLSQDVLDRKVCDRLVKRYEKSPESERAVRYPLEQRAASTHCIARFEQQGLSNGASECGEGFSR